MRLFAGEEAQGVLFSIQRGVHLALDFTADFLKNALGWVEFTASGFPARRLARSEGVRIEGGQRGG